MKGSRRGRRAPRQYRIAVFPGDGIGPEVVREGLRVLAKAASLEAFTCTLKHYPYGGQHYLDTGELLPPSVVEECRAMDAIYLGAIGDPRLEPGLVERSVIFSLRFGLDLYVNLRPIVLLADHLCPIKGKTTADVDLVVVRENTECVYAGLGGILKKDTPHEVAVAEMIYTRDGVERCVRYAFELARKRGKKRKVTLVDKANAVIAHNLWRRVFARVGEEYPDITKDYAYIDAACMWMVKNPEWFDVIVTPNLFGDIITDLGAIIQGGMGIAASGNIHPGRVSMFEPIHGSAPKYAGRNVANPLAAIAAVGMMLDYLGEGAAACRVEGAIRNLLVSGRIPSLEAGILPTTKIGDLVVEEMERVDPGDGS